MSKMPAMRASLIKRIALLVSLILFCVANSGFFCPFEMKSGGGIDCFRFRNYRSDEIGVDWVQVKLPSMSSFGGFGPSNVRRPFEDPSRQSPGAPQGADPVVVGFFSYDQTGDNFLEETHNILAPSIVEAFVDANDNGAFDAGSELRMVFNGGENTITITNPAGGTPLPMGYYSFNFFNKILFLFGPGEFGVTASVNDVEETKTRFAWPNTSVLPHVPFGEVRAPAGGELLLSVLTDLVLINAQDADQNAGIRFRSASTGQPQAVTIDGTTASVHNIAVPANTSRVIRMEPDGVDLTVVWATVTGFGPLSVATNFVSLTPGPSSAPAGFAAAQIDAQAGIAAAELDIKHLVNVEKTSDGIDTALAIVNLTSKTATVKLSLFESSSATPGSLGPAGPPAGTGDPFAEFELSLDSNTQVARFFDELLDIVLDSFAGTLILESDAEIGVTSLRTIHGKQSSSLPSGTP